jgi:hypothetical protein
MLTPISLLWLPAFVATLFVFLGGFIVNMLLPHHRSDWSKVPNEEGLRNTLNAQKLERGQYTFPFAATAADAQTEDHQKRVGEGPNGFLIIGPNEVGPSARQLVLHYIHVAFVSVFVAYVCSAAIPVGADYLKVFQVSGTSALLAYTGSVFALSIWYHFAWAYTWRRAADGLFYALLTAGTFGWLWPMVG